MKDIFPAHHNLMLFYYYIIAWKLSHVLSCASSLYNKTQIQKLASFLNLTKNISLYSLDLLWDDFFLAIAYRSKQFSMKCSQLNTSETLLITTKGWINWESQLENGSCACSSIFAVIAKKWSRNKDMQMRLLQLSFNTYFI